MIDQLTATLRGLAHLGVILATALALRLQVIDLETALAITRSHR